MRHCRLCRCLIPPLLFTVLLTSCAGQVMSGPGNTEPTTSAQSSTPGLTGSQVPGGGKFACVDWVRYETPQEQYDNAALVIIGKSVSRSGETIFLGHEATTHRVEVEQVLKGRPGEDTLPITSPPPTCTARVSYPDGDPLDTAERVIIFASNQGDAWFTLTPAQGVMPFPHGTELPFRQVE